MNLQQSRLWHSSDCLEKLRHWSPGSRVQVRARDLMHSVRCWVFSKHSDHSLHLVHRSERERDGQFELDWERIGWQICERVYTLNKYLRRNVGLG